jgi:hypothetical protein
MAQEALVQEFRGIVEGAIKQNVRNSFGKWPRMDQEAHVNGLVFNFVDPRKSALEPFPMDREAEHLWGIAPDQKLRIGGYSGRIAIISLSNHPGLLRSWAVEGAMQFINPKSIRELEEDEVEPIVAWARSPHLYEENFIKAATLTEAERAVIDPELARLAESAEELRQDLAAMDRARRPGPDWDRTIIY